MSLVVVSTHPIQYHAPVYRMVQTRFGIPVTVIYGSDFSTVGYRDAEFDTTFAWDSDLLTGYTSRFLSHSQQGGARSVDKVSTRGMIQALRESAPRAVLISGYCPRFYQRAFLQAWWKGCPILFRGEVTDHASPRHPWHTWCRDITLRQLYARCAKLLYIGRHSYDHYRRLRCHEQQLVFSPYCVDTTPFRVSEADRETLRPAVRHRLGLGPHDCALLFSGKLSARKGPDLVIQAVRRLPEDIQKRTAILFLGHGPLADPLATLAQRLPAVRTHFLGFQNQTQLSQYYHAGDLLVLPSRCLETWGLVVNEALHHGLPCVVSDRVGCVPDLIEPGITGEICQAGAIASLAEALHKALALVGRSDTREACRQRVSRYSVDAAADGIATAYRAVVVSPCSKGIFR